MKNALEIPLLLVVVIGVLVIATVPALSHHTERESAASALMASVRQEVDSLSGSQESLRSLRLGDVTETYVVGSGVSMAGYFQFDGVYSKQSYHIYITWRKADKNAPIDKIEIGGAAKELRTIWSRTWQTDAS